ncbi:MAG: hypothetical protein ACYCPS_01780 [Candidatus Saccharimonadales bacterium]
MSTLSSKDINLSFNVRVDGIIGSDCKRAVSFALDILEVKLSSSAKSIINGTIVQIANGLIQSGASTDAEHKKIILDADKNSLSLQEAEDLLVSEGILNPDDWTRALVFVKNEPWSCITYQLIHEFGHIIDGLSKGNKYKRLKPEFSPTKYGKENETEAFSEAFSYWLFDLNMAPEAKQVIASVIS